MLGWIERDDVEALYNICHLGICIDMWNIETATGARNRLTEMMLRRLPVLTTHGTEISWILKEKNLGFVIDRHNPKALASEINRIANLEFPVVEKYKTESFKFAMEYFNPDFVLFYFKVWISNPISRKFTKINMNSINWFRYFQKFFNSLKHAGFRQTSIYCKRYWKKLFGM